MRSRVALIAAFCSLFMQSVVQGNYIALKMCSNEICAYQYSANQESSIGEGSKSKISIRSTVQVSCDSIGKYKDQVATKYCLDLTDTSLWIEDEETESSREASAAANVLMSEAFCFVQTEDGKVVSVQHNPTEKTQIVNYKKGIAAAFQANFKKTEVEIEEDTQSTHHSRYSYQTLAPDHVIMHRSVDSEDVIEFASSEQIGWSHKMKRDEDIEYKGGRLLSSSGTTLVAQANGPAQPVDHDNNEETSGSDTYDAKFGRGGLKASGKHLLQLQGCRKRSIAIVARSVQRTSYELTAESTLHAQYDEEGEDYAEMGQLRQNMPSLRQSLTILHGNLSDFKTGDMLRKLLILESKYGPLPGYQPALAEVEDYLNELLPEAKNDDLEMRTFVYSLLAAEGTLHSQEILLRAIETTSNVDYKNSLVIQLAFVRNVHPDILTRIENLITSSKDPADPLILSYGALAYSSSSTEVQHRIVHFLTERMEAAKEDHATLTHLVHSLGNTNSNLANKPLLNLITHDTPSVKMAAAYALRYSIHESKEIQRALADALRENTVEESGEFATMVVRALTAGAESIKQQKRIDPIEQSLFEALLLQAEEEPEFLPLVQDYFSSLGPDNVPKRWTEALLNMEHRRELISESISKTESSNWNVNNQVFSDLVLDQATRNRDVQNYPNNRAYLWSQRMGVNPLHIQLGFGAFAGFGSNPRAFKLFARGRARVHTFGVNTMIFDALASSESPPNANAIDSRIFAAILSLPNSRILIDIRHSSCTTQSRQQNLLTIDIPVINARKFIKIGFLNFRLTLHAGLGVTASVGGCINLNCVSATGSVIPSVQVGLSVTFSASIVEIIRGGIRAQANFRYIANPSITMDNSLQTLSSRGFCVNVEHGWDQNQVSISSFWQHRVFRWCQGRWIRYPCGFIWGNENVWSPDATSWTLPRRGMSSLFRYCSQQLNCPAIPAG